MRIILDECLPRRLLRDLKGFEATTVPRQGWAGYKNGELYELVEKEFDVFITMDSNIIHQQNLAHRSIGLIVLHGFNSNYETLAPLIPQIVDAIPGMTTGSIVHIGEYR